MKKSILFLFVIIQITSFAQNNEETVQKETIQKFKKNEIKVNFGMLLLKLPEISYERLFSKNQSFGVSFALSIEEEQINGIKYMISPNYRLYFGKKRSQGFFMEFNASLYEERVNSYYYGYYPYDYISSSARQTNFGIGVSAGAKLLTDNNWVGELNLGVGRDLVSNNDIYSGNFYPRLGFSLGRRF